MRQDEPNRGSIPPIPSAAQPIPPKLLDFQPVFDAALPSDWQLIGRCRGGATDAEAVAGGCFVLAHPDAGVALVDLLPERTPNAEALFRRLLNAVDFSLRCPGYLPVVHCAIGPDDLPQLLTRIEDGLGYDSVLTIAGRGRWVNELWSMLQAGVTWEALGQPPPIRSVKGPRAWGLVPFGRMARAGVLACGLMGLFSLGFAAALLMPPPEVPPQPSTPGVTALAEAPEAIPREVAQPEIIQTAEATMPVPGLPMPNLAGPGLSGPGLSGPGLPVRDELPLDSSEASSPAEARTAALLPVARRAGRVPLPIDRRCSEALFRFQQGGSLTSQEMHHVRQGCASWR